MDTENLKRGTLVVATGDLDPEGANVPKGTLGVVFEEANAYGDGGGPMVRWTNGGACNVYSDWVMESNKKPKDIDPYTVGASMVMCVAQSGITKDARRRFKGAFFECLQTRLRDPDFVDSLRETIDNLLSDPPTS
jgi:hypothetical protein